MTEKHNRQGLFYDVFARMENVAVSDVTFRVDLLFDNEIRLTGVVMKAYGPSVSLSHGYTRLLLELTDRHGRPMADRSIPNHPGNYSWKTDASEIRLSYTEMVKGEADIVLAYYQTAIVERHSTVVVRRDTVVVPPPVTRDDVATVPANVSTIVTLEPETAEVSTKMVSLAELSVQASTDLKHKGLKTLGFGIGGYGYDPSMDWITFYMNGFYSKGKMEYNDEETGLANGVSAKTSITSIGTRLGIGVPGSNVVIFGMLEFFKIKDSIESEFFNLSRENDGYDNSFGGGVKVFVDPSKSGVSFGVEFSELRRLGVSLGVTF